MGDPHGEASASFPHVTADRSPAQPGRETTPLRVISARTHAIEETEQQRSLSVPSTAELEAALDRATTIEQLADFDKMMSVLEEAGKRFKLLIDEAIRIAAFHLSGKRKLGFALLQHHAHGGDRSSSQSANLLGDGPLAAIDKDRRSRFKALARIPEEAFEGYLKTKAEKREIPQEAGALRCAAPTKPLRGSRKRGSQVVRSSTGEGLPSKLLDACTRCLGDIDVLVGVAKVKCDLALDAKSDFTKKAHGKVLVVDATHPVASLRSVTKLRLGGAIDEAIVVLPRDLDASWFPVLGSGQWSLCVPEVGPIVAHIGNRARGFSLVFSEIGVVVVAQPAEVVGAP